MRTETDRNKTMAGDYRHTQIPHCDENSNNNSTDAAELSLSTYNGPISGLQLVHKAVLFIPHAKGRVSCVTLPHQEVLLDASQYTDFLSLTSIEIASEISNLQVQTSVLFPVGPAT